MDTTAITTEIQEIRDRLAAIESERVHLAGDDFTARAELLDEEHRLDARLAELRAEAAEAGAGIAAKGASRQTDLTRSPGLPEH